uniref:Pre-mRNA-splicing factor SLU7 n=1 Tax=Panagrellus redivivus TaxID=6233 RepID=A0A7E4ZZ86_PANRE
MLHIKFPFRKGACENCGAMGHKKKMCLERPRSIGAKYTEKDIAPDDHVLPNLSLGYDSKLQNLRIREDPAKYLLNLNEDDPYYDPKSRSMRENPFLGVKGKEVEATKFAGENFIRYTGEVIQANQAQIFAWAARSKGIDVNATAEPTKLEVLQRNFDKERAEVIETAKKGLIEKYGCEEHLEAPAKELLLAQTEQYVEYNRKGKLIKGPEEILL